MNRFWNKKILIIEDEELIVKLLLVIFEQAGYAQVRRAETGTEGLRIAREWRPDLIISDLMHPGPDGFAVFEDLFLDPCTLSTKFIMISGCSYSMHPEFSDKLYAAGVSLYLEKPIHHKDLLACVNKVFSASEKQNLKGL